MLRHAHPAFGQQSDGQDQPPHSGHAGLDEGAERDQDHADQEHSACTDLVGHGARECLREFAPQRPEGEGQTDADQPKAGGRVDRRQEQAHGLARAHAERVGAGCGEQRRPRAGASAVIHPHLPQGRSPAPP